MNKYFLALFGFDGFPDFKQQLEKQREGFDSSGHSFYADTIIGLEGLKIPQSEILRYDHTIKEYVERLCKNRRDNITFKYFQYIAVLFTEIFLERYFNNRKEFLADLNLFVDSRNQEIGGQSAKFTHFTEADLKKLAFWMATGSGKTLIMHINYWQFLKYKQEKLDNIILITPNEGMSNQHYREMQKSGVPCRLYTGDTGSLSLYQDEVLIIDLYKIKLPEEKKGKRVTVETEYFAGKNLVLIDEGHKGQTSEEQKWKITREEIGKDGFIFEYSATFGQVIGPFDTELLNEYSKAIIFDYSYKYFYNDGYGKDFYVYNLSERSFQEKSRDLILTANLLSFYEQILLYESNKESLREYNIEKPLWAFIGSKVSGAGINSDILKVVEFLKSIIDNKKLLKENIDKILGGKSGLIDPQGDDIFKNRFERIRQNGFRIEDIYQRIFNATSGVLAIYELKSVEGELGLKIGEGEYFGCINIGDVSSFKKLLTEKEIEVKPDNISQSLFNKVNDFDSNVNILIGAKKFIEGWDSWRVCSMALINMGKGEGPQIIQLFGRGVRLKGRNLSLKRSEEKKFGVKSLETLNIFGLNADYINRFLDAIGKEEVEYEEIQLDLRFVDEKKWERLYVLNTPKDFDFSREFLKLEKDDDILNKIRVDIRPKVGLAHGLEVTTADAEENPVSLEDKYLELLNWDDIYLETLNYKVSREYGNLGINRDNLPDIVKSNCYGLYALPEQVIPEEFADLSRLQEIVIIILKNYLDRFYNFKLRKSESRELKPVYLVKDHENLSYVREGGTIKIPKKEKDEIKKIRQLLKEGEKLYKEDIEEIPTIHFDRHLYTPLVAYGKEKDYPTVPPRLNKGETKFIKMLREYLKTNKDTFKDEKILLLRNISRRGVGFFQTSGYYPDFIMWRKKKDKQRIIFIDPKGIKICGGNFNDDKIQLYNHLKEVEKNIKKPRITLDSFILSESEYKDVKKQYNAESQKDFEDRHILFTDDKQMCQKLLTRS
ncbi:MAG: DEAD/DEAH box helicase family protein [Planctomycetota bacterium]|nr:DEAD/DEAH box helicase family protein [Planctomycetota bacterium]